MSATRISIRHDPCPYALTSNDVADAAFTPSSSGSLSPYRSVKREEDAGCSSRKLALSENPYSYLQPCTCRCKFSAFTTVSHPYPALLPTPRARVFDHL